MIKNKYFEDFNLGDKYILPSRTQTSGIFSMFQGMSGDNDPIHYDVEFCKQRGHKNMLAHGMQVMSQTAAGAGSFPSEVRQSLLGMIEIWLKVFLSLSGIIAKKKPSNAITDPKANSTFSITLFHFPLYNRKIQS